MNHLAGKLLRIALLSAVLTTLLAVTALAAEPATGVGALTGSSVRLRAEASTDSATLTYLDKSTAVAILEKLDGWYKVSYSGKTGYVAADYLIVDQDGVFKSYGAVNSDGVNVRSAASADASSLAVVDKDTTVTVTGFLNGWYSVTCEYGTSGYIRSDFVDLTNSAGASAAGAKAAELAKQYLGVRYSYGGASPKGFDCSGFTMYVYSQLGYSLPHTASGQLASSGTAVSRGELQPGDLVVFRDPSRANGKPASHVGIYVGGGQFIHASSGSGSCVKYNSLNDTYYNTYYVGAKRVAA